MKHITLTAAALLTVAASGSLANPQALTPQYPRMVVVLRMEQHATRAGLPYDLGQPVSATTEARTADLAPDIRGLPLGTPAPLTAAAGTDQ